MGYMHVFRVQLHGLKLKYKCVCINDIHSLFTEKVGGGGGGAAPPILLT